MTDFKVTMDGLAKEMECEVDTYLMLVKQSIILNVIAIVCFLIGFWNPAFMLIAALALATTFVWKLREHKVDLRISKLHGRLEGIAVGIQIAEAVLQEATE